MQNQTLFGSSSNLFCLSSPQICFIITFCFILFYWRKAESEIMWEVNSATFNYRSYQVFSLPFVFLQTERNFLLQTDWSSASPCLYSRSLSSCRSPSSPSNRENLCLTDWVLLRNLPHLCLRLSTSCQNLFYQVWDCQPASSRHLLQVETNFNSIS